LAAKCEKKALNGYRKTLNGYILEKKLSRNALFGYNMYGNALNGYILERKTTKSKRLILATFGHRSATFWLLVFFWEGSFMATWLLFFTLL